MMDDRVRLKLLSMLSSYQDEMIGFTSELVTIPTENPPGYHYRACADAIARRLDEMGLGCQMTEVPQPEGAVSERADSQLPRYWLQSYHGQGKRTLYFHGHYDVVPASNSAQFQPYVQSGLLFGRGSSDMKSGLVAMIYAVRAIRDCALDLDGRVGLTIVPDEETGGALGSRYLADAGLLGKDGVGMLMPEPTSGVVWNANRGAISLRITVRGRPAHVGLHYEGVNAFEQMLIVAGALRKLKIEVESRRTSYRIAPEAARRSILMMGGRCEGGTNFNLVPGECSFTIDRRINPEEDLETEKNRMLSLLDRLRREGIDLDVEVLQEASSAGVSEREPLAEALASGVEDVVGLRPEFEMCPGVTEFRFYAERGIPAFAYGPGVLSVSHGPNEYVEIESIYRSAVIYALTAARMLAAK